MGRKQSPGLGLRASHARHPTRFALGALLKAFGLTSATLATPQGRECAEATKPSLRAEAREGLGVKVPAPHRAANAGSTRPGGRA
jgi:hypothetical protein